MVIKTYFQNIADAIRAKGGTVATLTPAQMPQAIADLPTGGGGLELDLTKINLVGLYATARRGGGTSGYVQISEIELSDGTNTLTFPTARQSAEWGGFATNQNEFAANVFDGSTNTKGIMTLQGGTGRFSWFTFFPNDTIDCTIYNTWRWYTANDAADRDPVSFGLLLGSGDLMTGEVLKILDFQTNYNVTSNRKSLAYEGAIL